MSCAGAIRIGISGWTYGGWRGTFYPRELRHGDELSFASQVDTIEINGTHYSLQHPDSFARWHDETPQDFVFAVKGSRFITHLKQLRDIETPLANFFASGVLRLEEKLGPFLWQFSPLFRSLGGADQAVGPGVEPNDARLIAPDLQPPRHNARDVYVYFDNDAKVRAPVDARSRRAKLSEYS